MRQQSSPHLPRQRTGSQPRPHQRYRRSSHALPMRTSQASQGPQGAKALVLVSMQRDFFCDLDGAKLPLKEANEALVERCNALRKGVHWDVVVLTRTWHPSNHISFISNNPGLADVTDKDSVRVLRPDHCVAGSPGAELHPRLHTHFQDHIINTGLDPASFTWGCSDDAENRKTTPLTEFLQSKGVRHVFVAGIGLEGRIKHTVLQTDDIARHEWKDDGAAVVNLVRDACAAESEAEGEGAVEECRKHGIDIVSVRDVCSSLGAHREEQALSPRDQLLEEVMEAAAQHAPCNLPNVQDQLRRFHELDSAGNASSRRGRAINHECGALRDGRFLIHALCELPTPNAVGIATFLLDEMLTNIACEAAGTLQTPLLVACAHGNWAMVEMLLEGNEQSYALRQAELRRGDAYGMTALLYALQSRSVKCVQALQKWDNDLLGCRDRFGRNALMVALEGQGGSEEGKEIFDLLRLSFPKKQWRHEQVDRAGWCVWHYAVKHNAINELRDALDLGKPFVERRVDLASKEHWMRYRTDAPAALAFRESDLVGPAFAKTHKDVSILHLAVACGAKTLVNELVHLFKAFDIHNKCMANGLNALDVALESLDPTMAFELVKAGCLPSFYANQDGQFSVKVLLYKALFLGEASVVRILLTDHGHTVQLDRHILNLGTHQKYINICSNHFPYRTENLQQPWYYVDGVQRNLVCTMCALRCHASVPNRDVTFHGIQPGRCNCATLVLDGPFECLCQTRKEPDDNTHINRVKVPPVLVLRKHIKTRRLQVQTTKLNKRFGNDLDMAELNTGNLISGNAVVDLRNEDMHCDYIVKVMLMSAASYGQEAEVRELVRMVNDVEFNDLDESEETPLHAAVRFNHPRVCSILVSRVSTTSKLTTPNAAGATYLTLAAAFGHYDICKIVGTDESLFKLDSLGLSPIHHAVRNNHPHVVRHLARRIQTAKRRNPRTKHENLLDELFLPHDFTPETDGHPLLSNSFAKQASEVSSLGYVGLDVEEVRGDLLSTAPGTLEAHANPLHLAVWYGRLECVSELLKAGASPSHKDSTLYAPYKTALWKDFQAREQLEASKRFLPAPLKRPLGFIGRRPDTAPGATRLAAGSTMQRTTAGSTTQRATARSTSSRRNPAPSFSNRRKSTSIGTRAAMTASMGVVESAKEKEASAKVLDVLVKDRTIKAIRRRFALKRFYQAMLVPLALALVFLLLTVPKSSATYFSHRWIGTELEASDLEEMNDFRSVWGWVETRMVNASTLLPSTYDPTTPLSGLLLLGPMQIRQQVSLNETSALPIVDGDVLDARLPSAYAHSNEDVDAFSGLSFAERVASPECSGLFDEAANNPWAYTPASSFRLDVGSFGEFDTGGYRVLLYPDEGHLNQKRIRCLSRSHWVSRSTRFVAIDASLYNMNTGVFTGVHITCTMGLTGQLLVVFNERSSTLGWGLHDAIRGSLEQFDYPSTAMELVAFVELFGTLVSIALRSMNRYRAGPGGSAWAKARAVFNMTNLYDIVLALLLCVLLGFDFYAKKLRGEEFGAGFSVDQHEFVKLFDLLTWVTDETSVLALVTLMVWLRVLVHTLLLPVIGPLIYAIFYTMQSTRVLTFLGLLLYMMTGFLFAFRLVLAQIYQCRQYFSTAVLLAQLMIEEWSQEVYSQIANDNIGPLLLVVFMTGVSLIYMNLFISVLAVVYPTEKEHAERQYDDLITHATQEEYRKRTNVLLAINKDAAWVRRALHNTLYRPVMDRVAEVVDLVHPNHEREVPQFGWGKPPPLVPVLLDLDNKPHPSKKASVASA